MKHAEYTHTLEAKYCSALMRHFLAKLLVRAKFVHCPCVLQAKYSGHYLSMNVKLQVSDHLEQFDYQ